MSRISFCKGFMTLAKIISLAWQKTVGSLNTYLLRATTMLTSPCCWTAAAACRLWAEMH